MLPEEQLVRVMRQKRAGLWDMYNQQNNLGGAVFTKEEDPLTSLLGSEFNNKYRGEYADTLHNGWFSDPNRLTSRTGARLLNDLNEMNERGSTALSHLVANKDRTLQWLNNINRSRVGVGGYTNEDADRAYSILADKLDTAHKIQQYGGDKLLNELSNKFVKGKLNGVMNTLSGAIESTPTLARPLVTDFSSEFTSRRMPMQQQQQPNVPAQIQQQPQQQQSDNILSGAGRYLLPALLLGAAGGGLNKLRGGSILTPLILMLLLGGAYGMARYRGYLGGDTNPINSMIDKYTNVLNNAVYGRQQQPAQTIQPRVYS